MIRDERAPTSHGEKMVLNNYRAMKRLLEIGKQSLALDDLLEIHSILGEDALDSPDAEGRLRTAQDNVRVEDATTGDTWFVPPPASELVLIRKYAFLADSPAKSMTPRPVVWSFPSISLLEDPA